MLGEQDSHGAGGSALTRRGRACGAGARAGDRRRGTPAGRGTPARWRRPARRRRPARWSGPVIRGERTAGAKRGPRASGHGPPNSGRDRNRLGQFFLRLPLPRVGNVVIGIALAVAAAHCSACKCRGRRAFGSRPPANQGHRRGEGGAGCHRRPPLRQARLHHRGARTDLPARQGPASASRGSAEVAGGSGRTSGWWRSPETSRRNSAIGLTTPPCSKKLLRSNETFVYLARAVDPVIADAITKKSPEVGAERQDIRQYPGGSLAANVVGGIDWDGHGLLGLERRWTPCWPAPTDR